MVDGWGKNRVGFGGGGGAVCNLNAALVDGPCRVTERATGCEGTTIRMGILEALGWIVGGMDAVDEVIGCDS